VTVKAQDYKKIVDDKKMLQIGAFSYNQEDYGTYHLWFTSSTKYL
jgi:hypothetical protein